jgi:hypothetical protein
MGDVNIRIKVKMPTATKLITELQSLKFRDASINVKMVEALRKMADAIEHKKIGITAISTSSDMRADEYPSTKFCIEFLDYEHQADKKHPGIVE